ncbi:MAG: hypothetical protein ACLRPV_14505 [Lacrimispora saccharolytica]
MANNEEKIRALEAALGQIEKQYGKGSVMKLGDSQTNMNVETVPTGSLSLDIALGLGGVPKGRIIEVYGPESSGKTTVALHMVAEVQKRGGIAGFIDAEHALDPVYAKNIGVDIDNLYISQPDNGEQALEITETMVRSGAVDIIIVDSVAALVPKAEIDGDMGDSHVGLQARLMSQALRLEADGTAISVFRICISQPLPTSSVEKLRQAMCRKSRGQHNQCGSRVEILFLPIRLDGPAAI